MGCFSLGCSKFLLALTNFLLLICGFTLITGGLFLLFDPDRILLSKLLVSGVQANLHYPLMYYCAIGITILGCILALNGVLGCWASCMNSYWMLTIYFLVIILILIGECVLFATIWAWPSCLGLGLDSYELTKAIQGKYGKEEQEEFTAAIDLAQTMFQCCGVESANEYDTSLWRLQSLGHSLAVPLTCCKLNNLNTTKSYLNPIPINTTLCQALETSRHEQFRHLNGCKDYLDQWYRDQYIIVVFAGLILVIVEFLVLLCTLLTCTRVYKAKQEEKETKFYGGNQKSGMSKCHDDHRRSPIPAYSNETYALTDNYRHKLMESL